jgi:hypothetical protein
LSASRARQLYGKNHSLIGQGQHDPVDTGRIVRSLNDELGELLDRIEGIPRRYHAIRDD